jgi:hypothetical protein
MRSALEHFKVRDYPKRIGNSKAGDWAFMTIYESKVIYPDGEGQDIEHKLTINQLVDLNGSPLRLPLQNPKTIVFRVFKRTRREIMGVDTTKYFLELVPVTELEEIAGRTAW